MPIKLKYVLKNIVNTSDNIEETELILTLFRELNADAVTITEKVDVSFEILVKMVDGVITVDELDTDGELSILQMKKANKMHAEASNIVRQSNGPGAKIKLKYVLKN